MIGFIETENYTFWQDTINQWIKELSITYTEWDISEQLNQIETIPTYSYLTSKVLRIPTSELKLHHIWIDIQ